MKGEIEMAYVKIPNDLSRIKTKVALNLTKRQLLCFMGAAAIGIPTYLLTRSAIGNTGAMVLMIALMLPFFFFAMYERDGLPAEKVARNIIRVFVTRPGKRPYRTENMYAILTKEDDNIVTGKKDETAAAKREAQK
jgi:hypothetical protein